MFFKERKIVKELTERAGRGQADAEFELAQRYESGRGVKRDLLKALKLYEESAEHGCAEAQLYLGELYFNGKVKLLTAERDYVKAAYWYEKALGNGAELTEDIAMELGEMYRWGENGFQEDEKKAIIFYGKPAEKGNLEAQKAIASCYYILEDKENAIYWQKKACENGGADEVCALAAMYDDFGDYDNALINYRNAADMGDSYAVYSLGVLYSEGRGVKKDIKKAEEYFRKSAELGCEDAKESLKLYSRETVD